jgi:hypothetical protein
MTEGNEGMAKDDDREVSWAPKKIRELQRRTTALEEAKDRLFELVGQIEARLLKTERDIRELLAMTGYDEEDEIPDGGIIGYVHRQGARIQRLEKRMVGTRRVDIYAEPEFSEPVGQDSEREIKPGLVRQIEFERGFTAGLIEAASRARRHMEGSFSEALIRGLIVAIRSEVKPSDGDPSAP